MKFATTNEAERLAALAMPAARRAALLALDRASVRQVDTFGHMAIQVANLSAAGVSSYEATQIPGWQALGLQPGQMVALLRPPGELEKAAPTLCGKPILAYHRPIDATSHPHKIVVGAVGNDVRFEDGWVRGGLTLWDQAAIEAVEDGSQRSVSCGYSYVPVMEGGAYQGDRFQGRMTRLQFNHLAVCDAPRIPGCVIGDAALQPRKNTMANTARPPGLTARDDDTEIDANVRSQLMSYLGELLPKDQLDDVETILGGGTVTAPSMATDAAKAIARRVVAVHREKQDRAYLQRFPDAARMRR